jgi:hypothetical protein
MKRFNFAVAVSVLILASFAFSASAQQTANLGTSVDVTPSVSLSIGTNGSGLTVTSNAINFGGWGAYGYSTTTKVTFVPVASNVYKVYTPVDVTATGANASTYSLTVYGTAPSTTGLTGTAPVLLAGVGTPGSVSVSSSSPDTLVTGGTAISNTTGTTTTVNVGYSIATDLVKTATGPFTLGGSLTFTALAN